MNETEWNIDISFHLNIIDDLQVYTLLVFQRLKCQAFRIEKWTNKIDDTN